MRIYITTGVGDGPTSLAAYDKALTSAGISNFNLIYLSSVIPPDTAIINARPPHGCAEKWGDRLYVVSAQQREVEIGSEAWAGLGWVQENGTLKGLFVEHHGNSKHQVEAQIQESLASMLAYRDGDWGTLQHVTIGVTCADRPVCAVAAAVYSAEGW